LIAIAQVAQAAFGAAADGKSKFFFVLYHPIYTIFAQILACDGRMPGVFS
jgi:hypothetical protein